MKILCVGEMLVDLIVRPVEAVSFQNETHQVEEVQVASGGDANNNAVNLARLGHEVFYMGRVGCDALGEFVLDQARRAGVNMDYAVRSRHVQQTKSVILMNKRGDRTFLQCEGTSAEFSLDDCDLSLLDRVEILQIAGTFHLPRFDGEGASRLLRLAREKGVVTSMDITTDRSGRWPGILDGCYPHLDYFLPSVEHASIIAGSEDPREIAGFFLERGAGNVAIKLGKRGSYFRNRTTAFYAEPYPDIPVVETTGAGDAFCAGFLNGVGEGLAPEECVTLATACSSFVIQAMGATTGMGDREAVRRFIQGRPPLVIRHDRG